MTITQTIYVELLDEGVVVYRPVEATPDPDRRRCCNGEWSTPPRAGECGTGRACAAFRASAWWLAAVQRCSRSAHPQGANASAYALSWPYRPNSLGWAGAMPRDGIAVSVYLIRRDMGAATGLNLCRYTPHLS